MKAEDVLYPILILGMLIIYYFISGLWSNRRKNKYKKIYQQDVTNSEFAKARHELTLLAIEKKINPKDSLFRVLYGINTFFLRRPDKYGQLSYIILPFEAMVRSLTEIKTKELENKKIENEDLTPVIKKTYYALKNLAFDHSNFTAILLRGFNTYIRIYNTQSKLVLFFKKLISKSPKFYGSIKEEKAKIILEKNINSAKKVLSEISPKNELEEIY
ncbi:MAG: hypothetical protein KTR26_03750 [Flammeovirgaceae bacterium]|nr:hypothetical protein [Flammeovirgaceae bacterium]